MNTQQRNFGVSQFNYNTLGKTGIKTPGFNAGWIFNYPVDDNLTTLSPLTLVVDGESKKWTTNPTTDFTGAQGTLVKVLTEQQVNVQQFWKLYNSNPLYTPKLTTTQISQIINSSKASAATLSAAIPENSTSYDGYKTLFRGALTLALTSLVEDLKIAGLVVGSDYTKLKKLIDDSVKPVPTGAFAPITKNIISVINSGIDAAAEGNPLLLLSDTTFASVTGGSFSIPYIITTLVNEGIIEANSTAQLVIINRLNADFQYIYRGIANLAAYVEVDYTALRTLLKEKAADSKTQFTTLVTDLGNNPAIGGVSATLAAINSAFASYNTAVDQVTNFGYLTQLIFDTSVALVGLIGAAMGLLTINGVALNNTANYTTELARSTSGPFGGIIAGFNFAINTGFREMISGNFNGGLNTYSTATGSIVGNLNTLTYLLLSPNTNAGMKTPILTSGGGLLAPSVITIYNNMIQLAILFSSYVVTAIQGASTITFNTPGFTQ